jgi:hypothetical protein
LRASVRSTEPPDGRLGAARVGLIGRGVSVRPPQIRVRPWHRREPGALVFLAVLLCTPVTVVLCIIALTGDVYRNAYDEHRTLQVWGPGNKVAAVLILLIQCFFIWALIMIG